MKYLKQLSELRVFSFEDCVSIVGNVSNANYVLSSYISKGYIVKIKKNYYAIIDLINNTPFVNKYEIACGINKDDFISHHSVFEYYGLSNQVYNTVDVSTVSFQNNFSFEDNEYIYHKSMNSLEVNCVSGIRITSVERAIVDSIKDSKNFDYYELIECISNVNYLDVKKITSYLDSLNIKLLYKKVGFILTKFKDKFNIDSSFFSYCKEKAGSSRGYYDASKASSLVYNSFWQLYVFLDSENQ